MNEVCSKRFNAYVNHTQCLLRTKNIVIPGNKRGSMEYEVKWGLLHTPCCCQFWILDLGFRGCLKSLKVYLRTSLQTSLLLGERLPNPHLLVSVGGLEG
jgi:hypothetical protein